MRAEQWVNCSFFGESWTRWVVFHPQTIQMVLGSRRRGTKWKWCKSQRNNFVRPTNRVLLARSILNIVEPLLSRLNGCYNLSKILSKIWNTHSEESNQESSNGSFALPPLFRNKYYRLACYNRKRHLIYSLWYFCFPAVAVAHQQSLSWKLVNNVTFVECLFWRNLLEADEFH